MPKSLYTDEIIVGNLNDKCAETQTYVYDIIRKKGSDDKQARCGFEWKGCFG